MNKISSSRSLRVTCLSSALLLLGSCNNSDKVDLLTRTGAGEVGREAGVPSLEPSQDYVRNVSMQVLEAGQELDDKKLNSVSLSGVGKDSTYTIRYTFIPQSSGRLGILSMENTVSSGATTSQLKMTWVSGAVREDFWMSDRKPVFAGNSYVLELSQPQKAERFNLKVSFLAVIDQLPESDVSVARVCKTSSGREFAIFPHAQGEAYWMGGVGRPFIGMHSYCGEVDTAKSAICDISGATMGRVSQMSCEEREIGSEKSFNITFAPAARTARLVCTKNGMISETMDFSQCRDVALDLSTLRQK